MTDYPVYILLTLGVFGIIGVIIWLGILTRNKDNGDQIQKNLGIVAAISAVLVGLFGVTAYVYFSANVGYVTPFVLIMTFVNTFLSLFAVSAASLQVVYS